MLSEIKCSEALGYILAGPTLGSCHFLGAGLTPGGGTVHAWMHSELSEVILTDSELLSQRKGRLFTNLHVPGTNVLCPKLMKK